MKTEFSTLPVPKCEFGYPHTQLVEFFDPETMTKFLYWMVGQTFSSCTGWVYNQKRGMTVTSGCGPHGDVYYVHDVERFLAGKPVID